MEEEAIKRRERLKALKKTGAADSTSAEDGININEEKTVEQSPENGSTDTPSKPEESLPKPKFRSYIPKTEELRENVIPKPAPIDVDVLVEDQLEAAKPESLPENMELTNLAPRKPDWDLKRDVAKSLEKLERRTQRAIAELIRERLAANKDTTDLAEAVKWVSETQEKGTVDDEWES